MARAHTSIRPGAGPILTPTTAHRLVQAYSMSSPDDLSPSEESSPDSLYSDNSPTLPQHTFEFDEFEEQDIDDQDGQGDGAYRMPAWGQWPEVGAANRAWASRSSTSVHGSVLSISPRGSISVDRRKSSAGSTVDLRKSSLSRSIETRRDSGSIRYGIGSRRSSVKSTSSLAERRRSSAGTNGSMDPLECSRLRHIASMNLLSRRFSEAIEIASPAFTDDMDQPASARRSISQWSPYSASSIGDDESEIHTAPYVPTPPAPRVIPAVLSNFPLSSVATDRIDLEPSSEASSPAFLSSRSRPLPVIPVAAESQGAMSTPPPPTEPAQLLRSRSRPCLDRAMTDYQFPPKSDGVPIGASAPRPILGRAISTPFFSANSTAARELELRAQGSFPIQRPALGTSPLRESVRRASVALDGARRSSALTIPSPSRRSSAADRRTSISASAKDDLRRYSFDRRMSLEGRSSLSLSVPGSRKDSDRRRTSEQRTRLSADVRRMSIESSRSASRKSSTALPMTRSLTSDSRVSVGSRKSSTMSIGEYGYLASEIDVATVNVTAPTPTAPVVATIPLPREHGRTRSARPAPIVLPSYTFPTLSPVPGSASLTPRYSPLDSFFGRAPYGESGSVDPLTPLAEIGSPVEEHTSPSQGGVLNRPRPIGASEFTDDSYLQRWKSTSIKAVSQVPAVPTPLSPASEPLANVDRLVADIVRPQQPKDEEAERKIEDTPLIPRNVVDSQKSPKSSLWHDRSPVKQADAPATVVLASPPVRISSMPTPRVDNDVSPTSSPHVEQIADMQTIAAALATAPRPANPAAHATPPITPRAVRKAVPVLTEAELVRENHIERELRTQSSMEQIRQAHRISVERAKSKQRESTYPAPEIVKAVSPKSKRRAQFVEPATSPWADSTHTQPPIARPGNKRHMTMSNAYTAGGLVSPGRSSGSGNAYTGNPAPRRSHVVFELPTWRPSVLNDSSPEILASASLMDGQSYILPNTPDTAASRPRSAVVRPGHSRTKSSMSTFSAQSHGALSSRTLSPGGPDSAATTPGLGSAVRPSMGRATSFTKFFSKAKLSAGSSDGRESKGARPTSMDGLAISGLKYRM